MQWSTAAACSLNLQHKLQKSTSEQHEPRLRSGSIKVVYKSDIYGYNDVKYNEYDNGEYDEENDDGEYNDDNGEYDCQIIIIHI